MSNSAKRGMFMTGQRLGSYEIVSTLGAGGMGEVWRARDTRPGREVAIKFLTADYAESADSLRRFEQEARTLAALNHPNILVVHDTGVHEGAPYFVSELLEGQTLREVLGGAQLPLRKATEYALQIAQGLAAAHSKGVIHRDLKPENLFVTQEGRVKILDFGLAKLKRGAGVSAYRGIGENAVSPTPRHSDTPIPSTAPTLLESTQPGHVLGTPSYMSPEQVRGEAADHRSDIFAFGAILYEMLSGQRAFRRETHVETMNAILKEEPPELAARLPDLPPVLERVVQRCLEKQPERRFQTAHDLAFALENLSSASAARIVSAPSQDIGAWLGAQRLAPWVIAVLAVSVAIYGLISARRASSDLLAGQRGRALVRKSPLYFPSPTMKGAEPGVISLVISPAGQKLVYQNADGLWLQWLDRVAPPTRLAAGEGIRGPFWSAGSTDVAYFEGNKLYRTSIVGGEPALICLAPEAAGPRGAGGVWLSDGRVFFTTVWSGIHQVPAKGGLATPALALGKQERLLRGLSALPGTNGLLFALSHRTGMDTIEVWAPGGPRKTLLQIPASFIVARSPCYSSGHILYTRSDENHGLWAFPFSPVRLERTGEPFRISNEGDHPSTSDDGTLLFGLRGPGSMQLAWVDAMGQITGTIGSPRRVLASPRFSPDEKRIAASVGETGNTEWQVWLFDVGRGTATPLVRDQTANLDPYWAEDGQSVLFRRWAKGEPRVWSKPVDGVAAERELFEGSLLQLSRSGRFVLLGPSRADRATEEEPRIKLSYVSLADPDKKLVALPESLQKIQKPKLSPDDRLLAYLSSETGQEEVYLAAFPGFTNITMVSEGGGKAPWWHPKGSELYYLSLAGRKLMSVTVNREGALPPGRPKKVFDLPDSVSGDDFDVTSDGLRFVMVQTVWAASEAERLSKPDALVVQNWVEELRRK